MRLLLRQPAEQPQAELFFYVHVVYVIYEIILNLMIKYQDNNGQ